jgi:hypothetical protein
MHKSTKFFIILVIIKAIIITLGGYVYSLIPGIRLSIVFRNKKNSKATKKLKKTEF